MNVADRPRVTVDEIGPLIARHWTLSGEYRELPGERDRNFRLTATSGEAYVVKVAHPDEPRAVLDLQDAALQRLARGLQPHLFPTVVPDREGNRLPRVPVGDGPHLVRVVTYLPGRPIAEIDDPSAALLRDVGTRLALLDRELAGFSHPAMHRALHWDSKHAFVTIRRHIGAIADTDRRRLVETQLDGIEARLLPLLPALRTSVIHNDANDYNLLVGEDDRVTGIIDFGDMVHTYAACDLANACAYLMLEKAEPRRVAEAVTRAYQSVLPFGSEENAALEDFIVLRLCLSVTLAAHQRGQDPDNAYLGITERPAWALLGALARDRPAVSSQPARRPAPRPERSGDDLLHRRRDHLSSSLSISYRAPLTIVRGAGPYLFDAGGRRYLDCVNNVCHVGHCHPRVVAAASAQAAMLNTNTRYLHPNIVEYAERLTATLPDPLEVCFFVNSGSEANDLALRLARIHTRATDVVVVDQAYHGHTASLIDVSPYKHDGPGGAGAPDSTHAVPVPDRYRGPYGYDAPDAGRRYAQDVERVVADLAQRDRPLAAFIAESILGCAGQIEFPPGYLPLVHDTVRDAGGVCIADEVQVGFGRVGTHMWGFETQDVVPDIVTMGKPIGNGHPLAAVVTTRPIAESFAATGMEYFNTFGGNPVSCAVGLAVLDVLEEEQLQAHALDVGTVFLEQLRALADRHPLVGDVRGRGLFLGVELVTDRATRTPARAEAAEVIERMKNRGILLSTDGPYVNVIKIKPPLVISRTDIEETVAALDQVLGEIEA